MSLLIFNQPYAIDFHSTDFWDFKTTPANDIHIFKFPLYVSRMTFSCAYFYEIRIKKILTRKEEEISLSHILENTFRGSRLEVFCKKGVL